MVADDTCAGTLRCGVPVHSDGGQDSLHFLDNG